MDQFRWNGAQELAGSSRNQPDICEQWLGFMSRNFCAYKLEKRPTNTSMFQIEAHSRSVAGFTLARFLTTAAGCRLRRDAAGIAGDGRDQFVLFMSLCGGKDMRQFGRSQQTKPGSYTLISAAESAIQEKGEDGRSDTICFAMPREFVDQRIVSGEDICARPHGYGKGLHNLVFETVNAFQNNAWDVTDDEFAKSARVVAELVLLSLGSSADLLSGERSIRASNLARAKRIIRQRLLNPDLALADVARESGLSLNYIHKLFRDDGRTMSEYLKGERLRGARELLESSLPRHMTITDIAFQCGFSDTAHFSKSFKCAFGVSPRDVLRRH